MGRDEKQEWSADFLDGLLIKLTTEVVNFTDNEPSIRALIFKIIRNDKALFNDFDYKIRPDRTRKQDGNKPVKLRFGAAIM